MPQKFNQLSASQIETLSRDKTVFFIPVGPMEDHGPHLPMGLDLEEAERLCEISAQKMECDLIDWVGVVFPKIPLGIDSDTSQLALTVRPYVLRDYLVDTCRSLYRRGFVHFVCFSGHLGPKQLTAIEEAGVILRRESRIKRWTSNALGRAHKAPTLVSATSALVRAKQVKFSPFFSDPEEHGGKRDTSVALAVANDLVDPSYRTLPLLVRGPSPWSRLQAHFQRRVGGYWGDPSEAQAAEGEGTLNDALEVIYPKLRAVWQGANPNSIFRSWYSVFPLNRSFFKAWFLALCVFTMVCLLWITSFNLYNLN